MMTKTIFAVCVVTGVAMTSSAWAVTQDEMTAPIHHHHIHHRHVARNRVVRPDTASDTPQEQVMPETQAQPEPEIFYHASGADGAH